MLLINTLGNENVNDDNTFPIIINYLYDDNTFPLFINYLYVQQQHTQSRREEFIHLFIDIAKQDKMKRTFLNQRS